MTRFRIFLCSALLILACLLPGSSAIPVAHAQVDAGLNAVGAETVLPDTDPRVIAARIINVFLGLVGIILVSLILYAGFLWMTSGGDAEKIERAKAYIRNAIIGLVLVLSSWAIATFVINQLLQATGGDGGTTGGGGGPGGGLGGSGTSSAFQVRSISPSGAVSIRNVQVRFIFSRAVEPGTASSSIQLVRASDGVVVDGSLAVSGSIVTFTPSAACPAPNEDRRCFDADTEFIARVNTGLRSTDSQSIVCGGFALPCEGRFTTGNIVDVANPTVNILRPFSGQNVSVNDAVSIVTRATDDGGISYVETFVDGASIGTGVASATSTPTDGEFGVVWDTTGVALGRHELTSRAFDIDANDAQTGATAVYVRPAYCFNGTQDGDETGLDCGGSCGACSGGSCSEGGSCASGVCSGGVCVEQPIITNVSPRDGRPGTLVTISGANFGASTGRVVFSGGIEAVAPAACSAAGIDTWSRDEVIVAVPDGATDGPIELTNADSSLSDTTNDDQGPVLDNFDVNDTARPGLCGASPASGLPGERVDFVGAGLGSSSERVFFTEREVTSFISWADERISLNTPVISPGRYAVRAQSGGVDSNAVSYRVLERGTTAAPVIDAVTPGDGPVGEYITIQGRNFGTRVGRVMFRNAAGEEGAADVEFPEECSVSFWSDTSVVVKVPARIGGLGSTVVGTGSYQIYLVRQDASESNEVGFSVNAATPRPGICAIRPTGGPVDTSVEIIGERFGSSGRVTFKGPGTARVESFVDSGDWSASRITTTVPAGSETGSVTVETGGEESNQVLFTVRNCNEDATMCSAAGETCCRSGACSVGGTCPSVSTTAQYAWRTSTGIIPINPQVVEECTTSLPASPSPWNGRAGGNEACVNSDIVIRFNTRLDPSTVIASGPGATMIVRRCTAGGDTPCATTENVSPATGFPRVNSAGDADYILFRPNLPGGVWAGDAVYEVILRTGISSDTGLPMLERAECGAGNGYCFQFGTRPASDVCRVGSVNVLPNPFTANEIGQAIPYQGFPRAADDICLSLNGSVMDWSWNTGGDGRASITEDRGPAGNVLDIQEGTALAETGDIPVPINASVNQDGGAVSGLANLFIRFVPPKVDAYGPNCDIACLNAAVWARFNVAMDASTVTADNVLIRRCTNENCRTFDPASPLDLSGARIELRRAPGTSGDAPLTYLVVEPTRPGAGGAPVTLLEPGRFYKVTLRGGSSGILSQTQLPLTGTNDPEGFSWVFRVKSGENPRCSVESVEVVPLRKIETAVGQRQLFAASPVSVGDACNRDGQPLISDQSYTWASSNENISKFVNGSGDGRVDTTSEIGPGCTNRCTPAGSDGVEGRVANCGNSVVETTNGEYCRNAAGTGPCAVGGSGCRTIHGVSCVRLPAGAKGGEECDDGVANGSAGRCSAACLWNPVIGGTCGNGVLNPGEQCEPGPGCSDACQLEGSTSGGSVCGNGSIGDGEACDDGNRMSGDGCSASCLHEGSRPVRALCGNGRLEPGETCERVAPWLPWPNAACDANTCLKTGTPQCADPSDPTCCGNGTVDPAEDCDDANAANGDGCSNRCLLEGSSASYTIPSFCGDGTIGTGELNACEAAGGDGLVDAVQLAEIVGDTEPDASGRMEATLTATYDSRPGQATHGLQCGFENEASCTVPGTGLTNNGCCAARPALTAFYPPAAATSVCRNVQISGTFNVEMDPGSIQTNFIVAQETLDPACPAGTELITDVPYTARGGVRGWFANLWSRIKHFFANTFGIAAADAQLWCVGQARGRVVVRPEGTGSHVSFELANALLPNTRYKVTFRGDPDLTDALKQGIRSERGVTAVADPVTADTGSLTWSFTTGPDICTVSDLRVRDTHASSPGLFTEASETHDYVADVIALSPSGVSVPLSPVAEYEWTWQPWDSSETSVLAIGTTTSTLERSQSQVTSMDQNGSSYIYGAIRITNDTVNTPSTTGRVVRGSALGTVLLCENPWPERALAPFSDSDGSTSLAAYAPLFVGGPYFNFSTLYCRDSGADGTEGDLPAANMTAVPLTTLDTSLGILRQYLLTFSEDGMAGDGIGFRIVQNPLHLSPAAWYASKGFTGSPDATTVDGYEALRDGSTVYVAGTNVNDSTLGPVYSNIYVLSHNPDASERTQDVFNQLVENFVLNVNIQNNSMNSCVNSADEPYVGSDGSIAKCTADWECLALDPGLRCASFKEKVQRDTKRIADFQNMSDRFESAYERTGDYPLLSDGSFVQTLSSSRWPSWQSTLSAAIGGTLPTDPVNRYLTCGRCSETGTPCTASSECSEGQTCEPTEPGIDPATCWNQDTQRYVCPRLTSDAGAALPEGVSRVYQYRAVDGGNRYELSTELEGPVASRYVPPLLSEIRKCSNVNAVCSADSDCTVTNTAGVVLSTGTCNGTGGIWNYHGVCTGRTYGADDVCGNGVVGPAEVCELGDTRPVTCSTGGAAGTKIQYCSDCRAFIDTAATSCVANLLCGNGRIDRAQCDSGFRYGNACTTDADCVDSRNPAGTTPRCVAFATPETCDDGALNGTYGRCNRTCSGYDAFCGDGRLSPGESCDRGTANGAYCDPATGCVIANSCSFDCRGRAPYCGDAAVNGPEQCDGNVERTTSAVCSAGTNVGEPCSTNEECGSGGVCGGSPATNSCEGVTVSLCTNDRDANGRLDDSCTDDASCTRIDGGIAVETGRCISRATQRTRGCGETGATACRWQTWSSCQPVGFCGNGVREAGEDCDDGNSSNNDACTNQCRPNVCGDGFVRSGTEECDYGTRNGTNSCTADYGSTCASCSTTCRQVASSGGFCGNGVKEGPEQCDGTEGLAGVSCRALGYDYAGEIYCDVVASSGSGFTPCSLGEPLCTCGHSGCWRFDPSSSWTTERRRIDGSNPEIIERSQVRSFLLDGGKCIADSIEDVIQCGSTCGFTGCRRCVDTPGDGRISGQVFDAIYSNQPVPNARVTLFNRGIRVTEDYTDENGVFEFTTINRNAACTSYRIIVDFYEDNPCTGSSGRPASPACNGQTWPSGLASPNESLNGGYWPFESRTFSYRNFRDVGLGDRNGIIYLAPRVGRGETLVIHTWNGSLTHSYLDAHLMLPSTFAPNRDVYWSAPGNIDLDVDPHGFLACFHNDGSTGCGSFSVAPQTMKYKRGDWAVTGQYGYYVVDYGTYSSGAAEGTWRYHDSVSSTVRIVTEDRVYSVTPPRTRPTDPGCADESTNNRDGKYWLVFTQSAGGGGITIPGAGSGLLLCNGSNIYGNTIPGETTTLPGPLQGVGS